jgi:sec-independent protein translocase protein TatA
MGQIGPWQLVIILVLVVIVFGSKKLPDTARALGKSLRILKSETTALRSDGDAAKGGAQAPADGEQQAPPKTIKAAPGDVASSRPVEEPKGNTQS